MIEVNLLTTTDDVPDSRLSEPLQALWWLRRGGFRTGPEWEKAHAICQSGEGTYAYDLVHALAHWIEGDEGNAAYWYLCVGRAARAPDIPAEWERIARLLMAL